MNVHVIVNPASGQDEPILSVLNREMRAAGVRWSMSVTQEDSDLEELVARALDDPIDRLLVYGGDGTVSAVADVARDYRIPLGLLPGGTGNVIAAELGLPDELEDALRVATDPESRVAALDAIDIGGRIALLRVGFGADARMIERADRDAKDRLGWLAYLFGAFAEVATPQSSRFTLTIDGERREFDAATCIVANVGRVGRVGLSFAPTVDPTDGRLDVFVIRSADLSSFVSYATNYLGLSSTKDDIEGEPAPFLHLSGKEIEVEADPAQPIHADGEVFGHTPTKVSVRKQAVRIVLPNED